MCGAGPATHPLRPGLTDTAQLEQSMSTDDDYDTLLETAFDITISISGSLTLSELPVPSLELPLDVLSEEIIFPLLLLITYTQLGGAIL